MANGRIFPYELTDEVLELCQENARLASIGGSSQVRSTDRKSALLIDQMVGQVANAALSVFLYGNLDAYIESRRIANSNPTMGDGGRDLPGLDIDVKGSLIRNLTKPLWEYNLPLRPRERHESFVYVSALIPPSMGGVFLMGWINERDITMVPESSGMFNGAFLTKNSELHSMDELTLEKINGYSVT